MVLSLWALTKCYCDLKKKVQDLMENPSNDITTIVEKKTIYEEYFAWCATNTTVVFDRNVTMTRTNVGRWQVRFDSPHTDWANYVPQLLAIEDSVNRDVPKVSMVEWTQNANGFDVQITVDDNWTAADPYVDRNRCFSVDQACEVVSNVVWASTWELMNVDSTKVIQSQLDIDDIHNNGAVVQFASDITVESGRSRVANVFTYTWEPKRVNIKPQINAEDVWVSNYRARVKMRILRNGVVIWVLDDLVMQQNTAYDGDATPNGMITDTQPWVNPVYTLERFDEEARTATLQPENFSNVCLEAIEDVQVLAVTT